MTTNTMEPARAVQAAAFGLSHYSIDLLFRSNRNSLSLLGRADRNDDAPMPENRRIFAHYIVSKHTETCEVPQFVV